jgi:hypothetical protein
MAQRTIRKNMSDINPYEPPTEPVNPLPSVPPPIDPSLDGLGGWLILVGIGIVFTPFVLAKAITSYINEVFVSGRWTELTNPDSPEYHFLWGPYIVSECAFNVFTCVIWLSLVYLFFWKKKSFPTWYIRAHVFTLAFLIYDNFAVHLVRQDMPWFDAEASKEIGKSLLAVCIWVPYMLRSKRVAATFRR